MNDNKDLVDRYGPWLVMLAVAVSFFYNLHAVPLFDVDEGAFSEATREMLARGDYVSTWLYGEPRYDKPILTYWLQAASVSALGLNELALRLPSALAASLWVGVIYAFSARLLGRRIAVYAGFITATALLVSVIAKAATADALLNLFIASAMLGIFLYYRERAARYLYLTFAAMGLGFLTKGPIAVAIPFLVSAVFFALRGDLRTWLRAAFHPGGLALFLAIALPWYVAQYWREGQDFIDGFFLRHNIGRFQAPMEGHSGGPLYYLPVLLLGVLPYTTVLLKGIGRLRHWWREDLHQYLALWFLFVLGFFSFSGTKLPHYLLYGMSGVFVLMALHLDAVRSRLWLLLPPALLFLFLLGLPDLLSAALPHVRDPVAAAALEHHRDYFGPGWRVFFAAALALAVYFMIERRLSPPTKVLTLGLVSVLGLSSQFLPVAAGILQQPVKEAALLAKGREETVVMWRLNRPSFNVYAERFVERRMPRPGELVVSHTRSLHQLEGHQVLYSRNGIVLLKMTGQPD